MMPGRPKTFGEVTKVRRAPSIDRANVRYTRPVLAKETVHAITNRRIPSLDGLRAISIGLVIVGHLCGTVGFPVAALAHEDLGHLGVKVFFVISGFLITSLLRNEHLTTGSISLKNFYIRRFWRIFPACYAFISVLAVLGMAGVIQLKHGDLLYAYTYLTNNHFDRSWYVGHLWSLAVEEQFYLLWPATLMVLGLRRGLYWAVVAFLFAPICRLAILWGIPSLAGGNGMIFPTVADAIATGCILCFARDRLHEILFYMQLLRSQLFMILPLAIVALNYSVHPSVSMFVEDPLINIAVAIAIDRWVTFPTSTTGRLLNTRPLVWVGVMSYSLYLWQQVFLNRTSTCFVTRFPLNIALAVAAACGSYYFVEKPCLQVRGRRARAREKAFVAAS